MLALVSLSKQRSLTLDLCSNNHNIATALSLRSWNEL